MKCRICDAETKPYLHKNGYEVLQCTRCGFGQVDVSAKDIESFYEQAYFAGETAHFAQEENCAIPDTHRYWIQQYLERLPKNQPLRVLEIGPGLGAPIAGYFQRERPEIEFAAIEISDYATERLRASGFNIFGGRVTEPATLDACRGRYDLIFGTEVIEHDPEPHEFVRAVHDMLKPGGWAAFTTGNLNGWMARWNREKWYYLDPPAHVSYYTPRAVQRLFSAEGFDRIDARRYGFNYIRLKLKTRLPGVLALSHLSNISTGMCLSARRKI